MKAVGMKTAQSTSDIATTGPLTSPIALIAASRGARPLAMFRSTFSTTTMASSTTMPMARTSPKRDRLFNEKPKACITARVPMRDTGTAMSGMIEARQVWRNTTTTTTTRTTASIRVKRTERIEARTNLVVS
jgi:hypothetical protein